MITQLRITQHKIIQVKSTLTSTYFDEEVGYMWHAVKVHTKLMHILCSSVWISFSTLMRIENGDKFDYYLCYTHIGYWDIAEVFVCRLWHITGNVFYAMKIRFHSFFLVQNGTKPLAAEDNLSFMPLVECDADYNIAIKFTRQRCRFKSTLRSWLK